MEPEPCCLLATTEKGGAWRRGGHPVSSFPEVLRGFVLEARHVCLLSDGDVPAAMSSAWLQSRCADEARCSSMALRDALEVERVVAECVEDVAEACRVNELNSARQELELMRLEVEVARHERDAAKSKCRAVARSRSDVVFEARQCREAVMRDVMALRARDKALAAERLKWKRAETEAKKVPALERELAGARREVEASRRREGLLEAARGPVSGSAPGAAGRRGKKDKVGFPTLEDKLILKVFSFLTAWGVLASGQVTKAFFFRVDKLFGMGSNVAQRIKEEDKRKALSKSNKSPPPGANGANGALSAETAAAIAGKLNAAEIKGIIALDQRAKRLDSECAALKAEKEDLKAVSLHGAPGRETTRAERERERRRERETRERLARDAKERRNAPSVRARASRRGPVRRPSGLGRHGRRQGLPRRQAPRRRRDVEGDFGRGRAPPVPTAVRPGGHHLFGRPRSRPRDRMQSPQDPSGNCRGPAPQG